MKSYNILPNDLKVLNNKKKSNIKKFKNLTTSDVYFVLFICCAFQKYYKLNFLLIITKSCKNYKKFI